MYPCPSAHASDEGDQSCRRHNNIITLSDSVMGAPAGPTTCFFYINSHYINFDYTNACL
jgi:hypothetical protein